MDTREILDQVKETQANTLSKAEQEKDAQFQALCDVVLRVKTDQARPGDVYLLVQLFTELNFSENRQEQIFSCAAQALWHDEQHKTREADADARIETRKKLKDLQAKHKKDEYEAQRAFQTAESQARISNLALSELEGILRKYKWFFTGDDPLKLRVKDCAKPPAIEKTSKPRTIGRAAQALSASKTNSTDEPEA